jgi:hypothetical protein
MKAAFGGSPRSSSRPNKSVTLGFVVTDWVWKEITVKAHDSPLDRSSRSTRALCQPNY